VTSVVENKTLDEIHAGDSVSIDRSLNRADLRLWASLTGNPNLDEHFIEARGVSTWATSLFFTLIGSKLPGIGSTIEGATTRYHRPVAIGEKVTATVTVKEVRRSRPRNGWARQKKRSSRSWCRAAISGCSWAQRLSSMARGRHVDQGGVPGLLDCIVISASRLIQLD